MTKRLTPRMKRQLNEARRRGYLCSSRIAKRTLEAWYGECMKQSQPFMMARTKSRKLEIVVDLAPASAFLPMRGKQAIEQLYRRHATSQSRGMVGSYTIVMSGLPPAHAPKITRILWLLLQEHTARDMLSQWVRRTEAK